MDHDFRPGDTLRPKPQDPPPMCRVIHVYADSQMLVEWNSGVRSMVSKPSELELVSRSNDA